MCNCISIPMLDQICTLGWVNFWLFSREYWHACSFAWVPMVQKGNLQKPFISVLNSKIQRKIRKFLELHKFTYKVQDKFLIRHIKSFSIFDISDSKGYSWKKQLLGHLSFNYCKTIFVHNWSVKIIYNQRNVLLFFTNP